MVLSVYGKTTLKFAFFHETVLTAWYSALCNFDIPCFFSNDMIQTEIVNIHSNHHQKYQTPNLDSESTKTVFSCIVLLQDKSSQLWSNALSLYRSQNVLCQTKFFVSDQKFVYILCQSQTFCARQKDDMHSVRLVFVLAQKGLKRH